MLVPPPVPTFPERHDLSLGCSADFPRVNVGMQFEWSEREAASSPGSACGRSGGEISGETRRWRRSCELKGEERKLRVLTPSLLPHKFCDVASTVSSKRSRDDVTPGSTSRQLVSVCCHQFTKSKTRCPSLEGTLNVAVWSEGVGERRTVKSVTLN